MSNREFVNSREVTVARPTLRGHVAIARIDHWIKNVFVLPGIVVALSIVDNVATGTLLLRAALGLLATCLIASSNYVVNELLDAPFDRCHPVKCRRPVPAGMVNIPLAYAQWLVLMVAGVGLGLLISQPFALVMLVFWGMGCVYNLPPLRTKDVPYLDVLSEAVNNPLRMLAGWYIVAPAAISPASLLLSYWMIGCYFMALKRFAELRQIKQATEATAYRRSFGHYTTERLLVSVTFYGSAAMLFFGAFIMRYRLELILSFPLVALVMALYMRVAFKDNSTVQTPERLYRERLLLVSLVACVVTITGLLVIDMPILNELFAPTAPTAQQPAI